MSPRTARALNGPAGLVLIAALAALLVAAVTVWVNPSTGNASPEHRPSSSPSSGVAPAYSRAQFGAGWVDTDHNGCRTRDDILARDLVDRVSRGCTTLSGVLAHDPYTGRRIVYNKTDAAAIQIDHVVSLRQAWADGAWRWSQARRVQFANDPLELLAVDGHTNEAKGEQGPGQWLPANRADACRYVLRFLAVKARYDLPVHPAERAAGSACPSPSSNTQEH